MIVICHLSTESKLFHKNHDFCDYFSTSWAQRWKLLRQPLNVKYLWVTIIFARMLLIFKLIWLYNIRKSASHCMNILKNRWINWCSAGGQHHWSVVLGSGMFINLLPSTLDKRRSNNVARHLSHKSVAAYPKKFIDTWRFWICQCTQQTGHLEDTISVKTLLQGSYNPSLTTYVTEFSAIDCPSTL